MAQSAGRAPRFFVGLSLHGGESPTTVVDYTPHGCRHVQVTAGAQMAAHGLISEQSLETFGHWERGSKMPERYDSASCVSELQTRKVITDTLRTGWRPAEDGSLPPPPTPGNVVPAAPMTPVSSIQHVTTAEKSPSASSMSSPVQPEGIGVDGRPSLGTASTVSVVVNKRRNMAHLVRSSSVATNCAWYTCGTRTAPRPGARFDVIGNAKKRRTCFGM